VKKPQRTKKKKVVTLSTLSRDIEDVNPEWYFFRCLFFYRAEISFVRRAKLFAHLEVLWITMAASRQPRRQPPMRYSTKCGLMLMVDGRFLFIAFQLETAAKSERRVERMLPLFFSFLEKRLIRFMAYRIKKKEIWVKIHYTWENTFFNAIDDYDLWIHLDYYTNFDF